MRQLEQQMTVSGNSPYTLTFPEAADQTFEVGSPVVLTAGEVEEAASPAAAVLGVAAMPASGVQGSPVTVWVANDDTLFGVVMAAGVQDDVGKLVTVEKTGALWAADRTTPGTFLVMEVGQSLPPGQVIARGKFLESASQLAKTA